MVARFRTKLPQCLLTNLLIQEKSFTKFAIMQSRSSVQKHATI